MTRPSHAQLAKWMRTPPPRPPQTYIWYTAGTDPVPRRALCEFTDPAAMTQAAANHYFRTTPGRGWTRGEPLTITAWVPGGAGRCTMTIAAWRHPDEMEY
jgi:hypothetical protein